MISRHNYSVIDSTNTEAKRLFESGKKAPLAVVSDRQTEGRGRMGRSWHSESEGGLYYSLLVVPKVFDMARSDIYQYKIGEMVARVLEQHTKVRVDIEWPNDLLIDQKKVGGILIETSIFSNETKPHTVVIGIGINLNQVNFHQDLKALAISFRQKTQLEYDKNVIAEKLSEELWDVFERD